MKTTNLTFATNYRDQAFETTGTSLMIVLLEGGAYLVTSRKGAQVYLKKGYEVQ
ncbi:hypothetical protein [Salmonirosea aquatica]|uniref:hypothetical protein n=1 Tax=Salmonirosea aquatica TaxID=2654236 RepID=UPI003570B091